MSRVAFPIAVTATSAITAAGDCVEQTCASIRAGIARLAMHPEYEGLPRDPEWDEPEPLVVASAPGIDPDLDGADRLLALLIPALGDLLRRGKLKRRDLASTGLFVALPAPDEAVARWRLDEVLLPELCRRTGLTFGTARASQAGHAGVLALVADAAALLAEGAVSACIVAGVDSYLGEDRLSLYDCAYRLKSDRNVDGFCPGEAAAALLLEGGGRGAHPSRRDVPAEARIAAAALGREPESFGSERQSTGRGLTDALRGAMGGGEAAWVLCDLNGESYRAFEWGIALARLGPKLGGLPRLVVPARCLGDIGAATGAVLVAAAAAALRRGYAPAPEAIVWTASDGSLRAAARVTGA